MDKLNEPPCADPQAGGMGGWRLETSGYPIRAFLCSHHCLFLGGGGGVSGVSGIPGIPSVAGVDGVFGVVGRGGGGGGDLGGVVDITNFLSVGRLHIHFVLLYLVHPAHYLIAY